VFDVQSEKASKCHAGFGSKASSSLKCMYVLINQKCSATKPTCDQCTKRKDRCVYDAIRPASRVEKLEKKLGEPANPSPRQELN
jgi:hypothetical protein